MVEGCARTALLEYPEALIVLDRHSVEECLPPPDRRRITDRAFDA